MHMSHLWFVTAMKQNTCQAHMRELWLPVAIGMLSQKKTNKHFCVHSEGASITFWANHSEVQGWMTVIFVTTNIRCQKWLSPG